MASGPDPRVGALDIDTSALVKLAVHEAESSAGEEGTLDGEPHYDERVDIQLPRAVARARADRRTDVADARVVMEILAAVAAVTLTEDVQALAAQMEPTTLRTLDAVHLASALTLGKDPAGMRPMTVDWVRS